MVIQRLFPRSRAGVFLCICLLSVACDPKPKNTKAGKAMAKKKDPFKAEGYDGNYVERLFQTVKFSKDIQHRSIAARRINKLTAEQVQAELRVIIQGLADDDKTIRLMAVNVLRRLGPKAEKQQVYLKKALRDSDRFVRVTAAQALIENGWAFLEPTKALIAAVRESPEGKFKFKAVQPLMRHAEKAKEAIPYLKTELKSNNADI
ncbi:MAG: HEAT repeat domain-containing protein, partial [Planctomycetota bacterium]|nr:HEAT repeat domain-containing protein [Planctomycetota bacterium]